MGFEVRVQKFRNDLIEGGIQEKPRHHSEFVRGGHGVKVDFDPKVIPPGSALYENWVVLSAEKLAYQFTSRRLQGAAIVAIYGGTVCHAQDVVEALDCGAFAAQTHRPDPNNRRKVTLTSEARATLLERRPMLTIEDEDVASTGSTTARVGLEIMQLLPAIPDGKSELWVTNTWVRSPALPYLDEIGVPWTGMIHEALPMYAPSDCLYCADDWPLRLYGTEEYVLPSSLPPEYFAAR